MRAFRSFLPAPIVFIISFNSIFCGELIELSCIDASGCKQFEQPDVNVTCRDGECRCNRIPINNSTTAGEMIECRPKDIKQSNMIGGVCPCQMPNAECHESEKICYCAKNYVRSDDKRRCVRASLALSDVCESDEQCHGAYTRAICDKNSKKCTCHQDFIMHNGTCVSVAAANATCASDVDCQKLGAHTACLVQSQKCICLNDYVKSADKSECIPVAYHGDNCTEHQQCDMRLGPGGACHNGTCQCDNNYYLQQKQTHTESKENSTHSICLRVIEIGQYCREDKDCYHQKLSDEEQTMSCMLGECNCKWGFNSLNNKECFKSSNAMPLRPMMAFTMALIASLRFKI